MPDPGRPRTGNFTPVNGLAGVSGADNSSAKAPKPAKSLHTHPLYNRGAGVLPDQGAGARKLGATSRKLPEFRVARDRTPALTRPELFKLRLLPTVISLAVTIAVAKLLWFPGPYSTLAGIDSLLVMMVVTNILLGPGLSALIYRHGKPGLGFDMGVLAAVELTALGLAAHALYLRQPAYTVFAVDRFEVVTVAEIEPGQFSDERLARRPGHEPRLAFAALPQDPEIFDRLLDETVFLGMPDIDRRPEFWTHYPAGIRTLRAAAKPLADLLLPNDERRRRLLRWLSAADDPSGNYVYLPIRGRKRDAVMIIAADTGYPVDILTIDPW